MPLPTSSRRYSIVSPRVSAVPKPWLLCRLRLFAAISVLMVYEPHGAGLAGGILGSVFGLAGGLFGTRASMHRARINRLLHDLRTQ